MRTLSRFVVAVALLGLVATPAPAPAAASPLTVVIGGGFVQGFIFSIEAFVFGMADIAGSGGIVTIDPWLVGVITCGAIEAQANLQPTFLGAAQLSNGSMLYMRITDAGSPGFTNDRVTLRFGVAGADPCGAPPNHYFDPLVGNVVIGP